MRPDRSVLLGTRVTFIAQVSADSLTSSSAFWPFRNKAGDAAFPQNRKTHLNQLLERRQRARGDDLGQNLDTMDKILHAHCMDDRRRSREPLSLSQERGLFQVAFDEMNGSTWFVSKRAGKHEPGKSASGSQIDPHTCLRRKINKLERIGDVPGPQLRHRGGCNQVDGTLPIQQECDKSIEPFQRFT